MKEIILKPSGWRSVPAWSLFTRVKRTGFPNAELLSVYRDHGVIPKASREDNHNVASEDLASYQFVEQGDLVVNKMKAWQGTFAVSEYEGIVSPAYFVFKPHHSESSKFLHYLLRSAPYIAHYNQISNGVRIGQWDLDPAQFRITQVVLPPLNEQKAIADFLDRELAQIDVLIAKLEQILENLYQRRSSLIVNEVCGGASIDDPTTQTLEKFFNRIPSGWTTQALKGLLLQNDGGVWGDESDGGQSDFVVLRSTEQTILGEWAISDPAIRKLSAKEYAAFRLLEGDIVVTKSSGSLEHIGKSTIVTRESSAIGAAYSNFMQRLRLKSGILPSYIWWYLNSEATKVQWRINSTSTTGLGNLNSSIINNLRVPVPPEHIQVEIAAKINKAVSEIDALISSSRKSVEILKERRQSLISSSVTGKIDVQKVA